MVADPFSLKIPTHGFQGADSNEVWESNPWSFTGKSL